MTSDLSSATTESPLVLKARWKSGIPTVIWQPAAWASSHVQMTSPITHRRRDTHTQHNTRPLSRTHTNAPATILTNIKRTRTPHHTYPQHPYTRKHMHTQTDKTHKCTQQTSIYTHTNSRTNSASFKALFQPDP